MIEKGIIMKFEEPWGNKTIIKYKVSEKGRGEILREKLEPYEVLFPRGETDKELELRTAMFRNRKGNNIFSQAKCKIKISATHTIFFHSYQ
jgi:hypothetical protein